jgi:hypothetical protein
MRPAGGLFTIALFSFLGTVFAGCGPKAAPVAPDPPDDPLVGGEVASSVDPTPDSICTRIFELKDQGCGLTSGYGLSPDECRDDFARSLDDRGPEARQANLALGRCLIDEPTCDAADACVARISEPHRAQETRTCEDRGTYAPVGYSAADFARRKGATTERFSQHASTKESPIEVCGIPNQMEWLTRMTCDDGSQPFRGRDHAHAARAGNVGPGGRCGSIVDLYEVPCPEGTYAIFIDAYVCPRE